MIARSRLFLLSTALLLLCSAASAEAATVTVKCSATKSLQAAINSAAAGVSTTINASGTCNENITVPRGKVIIIAGTLAGTFITPKNVTLPAVVSYGDVTIRNVTVRNDSGAAEALIVAELGGVIQIVGDDLKGPATDSVVEILDNSTAVIVNTNIGNSAGNSIDLDNAGSLVLRANPALPGGPNGAQSLISGQVFCGMGSTIYIRVLSSGSSDGLVAINTDIDGAAIKGIECALSLFNKTGVNGNLTVTSTGPYGISVNKSTLQVIHATISGNGGTGIEAIASSATVSGSELSNNGSGDINAGPGSTILIDTTFGPSTIPAAFVSNSLKCWPETGPHGQIFFDDGSIDGGDLADVTANNPGCTTKAGPLGP